MVHINHLSKRKKKENKRNNRSNNTAPAEFNPYNKDISLDAQTNPPRSQLNNEMDLAEGEGIKRVLFSWRGQHPPLSPQGRTNGRYPLPPSFSPKKKIQHTSIRSSSQMDYISRRQSSIYVHKPRDYSPYEFLTTLAVVWERRKTQLDIVLERRVIDLKR